MMKRNWGVLIIGLAGIVFGLYAATVVVLNAVYDQPEIAAPANPAAGFDRVYMDSTTHKLTCLTSAGGSCAPSGGGGGFIQTLTAPVSGNFSSLNFNTGTGVATTQVNNSSPVTSITLLQHDPNDTANTAALVKNKLAATFTLTVAFTFAGSSQSIGGLFLWDGSAINIFFGLQNNFGTRAPVFSNLTGGFSGDVIVAQDPAEFGPLHWVRIQETVSARIYSVSSDGITFSQLATEANTAHFTTTQYGFAVQNRNSSAGAPDTMITVYSLSESNP